MTAALLYGLLASAAFPLGVALGLLVHIPRRLLAAVIAFGAGTLVVALTFELMAEAVETGSVGYALLGLFAGTLLYIGLDQLLDRAADESPRLQGNDPQDVMPQAARIPESRQQAGISGMAVLMGTVLDGIPENAAIGMGLAAESGPGLGLVLLGAVFLSNLPGAIASTVGMRQTGRSATDRDSSEVLGLPVPWVFLFGVRFSSRRWLLTVRAAMDFASSAERPRSSSLCLTCSYCRSSLSLHACGIALSCVVRTPGSMPGIRLGGMNLFAQLGHLLR